MKKENICIIGLGYVGLPLAVEFGKKFKTIGFDTNINRIKELQKNIDITNEVSKKDILKSKFLNFTNDSQIIKKSNIYIITVPTPITKNKKPNLTYLKSACELVGKFVKNKDIIVVESTVYPGITEEYCAKIIEKKSKLKFISNDKAKSGFYMAYSPERINPGDKKFKLTNIKKIVSASSNNSLKIINNIYASIIKAGTYKAKNIKVAESAKVIENTQRDLNIALMNELSIIFNSLNINTYDVLEAAYTKWNFIKMKPGLVGGHCIGVDPYYLTYKAKKIGVNPKVILAGRKINETMHNLILNKINKFLLLKNVNLKKVKVLLVGATFKPNVKDIRNSKMINIAEEMIKLKYEVKIIDLFINKNITFSPSIIRVNNLNGDKYDVIIFGVDHKIHKKIKFINDVKKSMHEKTIMVDLTNTLKNIKVDITF